MNLPDILAAQATFVTQSATCPQCYRPRSECQETHR
ncbi:DUF7419 family protein [Mycolicibacterium setense]